MANLVRQCVFNHLVQNHISLTTINRDISKWSHYSYHFVGILSRVEFGSLVLVRCVQFYAIGHKLMRLLSARLYMRAYRDIRRQYNNLRADSEHLSIIRRNQIRGHHRQTDNDSALVNLGIVYFLFLSLSFSLSLVDFRLSSFCLVHLTVLQIALLWIVFVVVVIFFNRSIAKATCKLINNKNK